VSELDDHGRIDYVLSAGIAKLGREQNENWAKALAASLNQVTNGNLGYWVGVLCRLKQPSLNALETSFDLGQQRSIGDTA
jgi:hypothetical protein